MSEYTPDFCPGCGNRYKKLGSHWAQSDCEYPDLSEYQEEVVTGILMGDGCLCNRGGNPYIVVQCVKKNYLKYLDSIFGVISSGEPRLHITGDELKDKYGDWLGATKESEYQDQYRWQSRGLESLSIFSSWYGGNGKTYPDDIKITPTILKHWYAGDGNYNNNGTNSYISIGVSNESEEREKIYRMFNRANLPEPNRWNENNEKVEIVWNKNESGELIKFMGDAVPGYQYKWMEEVDE